MNNTLGTRSLGMLCIAAIASCTDLQEPTRMPVSASLHPDTSPTTRLFEEVNSYRISHGKRRIQRHAGLDKLALKHCEYLRKNRGTFSLHGKNVSHNGFEGRALIAQVNYEMLNVSENVAAAYHPGSKAPKVLLDLWLTSKDHRSNMLENWTHSGIAVLVDADGMVFATQIFGSKSYSQMTLRDRMNSF